MRTAATHAPGVGSLLRSLVAGKAVLLVLLLALGAPAAATEAPAPVELKLTVAVGPAYELGGAAQTWARLIAERSNGALRVTVVPGATLAERDPRRELAALRDGKADLAVASTLVWSAQVPALGVASLPWIAPTPAQLQAFTRGAIADRLMAAVDAAGVHALALGAIGHHVLATRSHAVEEPAALTGLTIRVQGEPLLRDLYAALGAKPVEVDAVTARDALARGELEGQDGSPIALVASRADMVGVRHVTLLNATGELAVFAVNHQRWTGLSAGERDIIAGTARVVAAELAIAAGRSREAALASLRSRGMTVTHLLPAAHAGFSARTRDMVQRWTAKIGPDLVDAAQEAAGAAR